MILVHFYVGSLDSKRFIVLVELEDPTTCAECGEPIGIYQRAIFAMPEGVFLHPGKGGCASMRLRDAKGRLT